MTPCVEVPNDVSSLGFLFFAFYSETEREGEVRAEQSDFRALLAVAGLGLCFCFSTRDSASSFFMSVYREGHCVTSFYWKRK